MRIEGNPLSWVEDLVNDATGARNPERAGSRSGSPNVVVSGESGIVPPTHRPDQPDPQPFTFGCVGDFLSGAGNALESFLNASRDRVDDAARSIGTGLLSAVVGAFKNVGEAAATAGRGFGKLFSGDPGRGLADLGMAFVKVVQTPVDEFLMLGGRGLSAIQTLIGVEPVGRELTGPERCELKRIFGDSIDFDRVRIKEGPAGLFSASKRAFVHGDTIYIPPDKSPASMDLLIHEMTHVWQHQNGGTDYMSEALWGQSMGDGYLFRKGLLQGKQWSELNPEQQASFIASIWEQGLFQDPNARYLIGTQDFTEEAREAIAQLRRGEGAP